MCCCAIDELADRIVVVSGQPEGDDTQNNNDFVGARADQLNLERCSHLVVTRLSTFGFVSYARARKRPWIVDSGSLGCQQLSHSEEGLVAGPPIHKDWPWQTAQFTRCVSPSMSSYRTLRKVCVLSETDRLSCMVDNSSAAFRPV
mmetsp:Transcript_31002/g.72778  ORF Transcript_31002/g.72778 Transcript_31002/m.72778 type:complete len:145 (+) Transcript_31002:1126-1560(+)